MNVALAFAGASCGAGVWVAIRGLTRRLVPSLGQAAPGPRAGAAGTNPASPGAASSPGAAASPVADLKTRAAQWSNSAVLLLGTDFKKFDKALRLCHKTSAQHAWAKVSSALLWGFMPAIIILATRVVGFNLPLWWGVVGLLIGLPAGYLLADRQLLDQAEKHRRTFASAFVAYLDLVKVLLAGGSHTDGALYQAAQVGRGRTFDDIRGALDWSRVHGRPLSDGLARLGDELGMAEITEVAATISLAETEGSSPSEALARKAAASADRALTEAQASANALTEKMSMPTVIIAFAFVVFIAYPALSSLSTAL